MVIGDGPEIEVEVECDLRIIQCKDVHKALFCKFVCAFIIAAVDQCLEWESRADCIEQSCDDMPSGYYDFLPVFKPGHVLVVDVEQFIAFFTKLGS